MSTNATIGIKNEDGTIRSVYLHWDGYPSYTGKMLNENYLDREKVEKLINLGNLSYLAKEVEPTKAHSFEQPQRDVTVAYHRDRGEDYNPPSVDLDINEFKKNCEQYAYLFTLDNRWEMYP